MQERGEGEGRPPDGHTARRSQAAPAFGASPAPAMALKPLKPVDAQTLADDPWHTSRLSLGCPRLDAALGGGIDPGGVTEIAGEAGAAMVVDTDDVVRLEVSFRGFPRIQ